MARTWELEPERKLRKLSADDVRRCRMAYHEGQSVASLAREHGVTRQAMNNAVTGRTHRDVESIDELLSARVGSAST